MAAILSDDTYKGIFLNEKVCMSYKISLKIVSKSLINNVTVLEKVMAWRRTGHKPLSEPMMVKFTDAYMRHPASTSRKYFKEASG